MSPVSIKLPSPQAGNEDMPVVVGSVNNRIQRNHVRRMRIIFMIKQQQFDS